MHVDCGADLSLNLNQIKGSLHFVWHELNINLIVLFAVWLLLVRKSWFTFPQFIQLRTVPLQLDALLIIKEKVL